MARRRAKGDGSITRRKNGLWQAATTIGYDENGKQLRKTVYGKTKEEVRKKLEDLRQQASSTGIPIEDPTLGAYLERWLTEKARQVKPRTVESYRYTVEKYIAPKLGRVRLGKLTPLRIQAALGEIADEVSPHTSNYCRSTLRTALDQAVKWQLLPRNPAAAVDTVRAEKREMTLWTTEQVGRILAHSERHRLHALFYLAITSGLRIGELLALTWSDLKGSTLHVRRNLTKQDGRLTLASTKTTKGQRLVALAADTLEVLAEHRQRQDAELELAGEGWANPGHMFTTEIGTFLDQRNVLRVWHRLQDQAGVPRARLHDARHLHVSLLVRHGLDASTIADRVGHTNPAFTLRQYTHLFEEQRLAAAVPLAKLLAPVDQT
ncbi:MAG: site-specific integrase [Truepera sp.]|jgi:integrase|nr:site-specific integrase [Truepera sp.]